MFCGSADHPNDCNVNRQLVSFDLSAWNTASATSMRMMFSDAYAMNFDVSSWMHCCEQSRIGDGICDSETTSTCDLTCYTSDGNDCGCRDGTILSCSGDGSCVNKRLLGDGICDMDLLCYDDDNGDCTISTECPEFRSRDDLFEAVTQYIELGRRASTEHPCGDINSWDVSGITDMSKIFCGDQWYECHLSSNITKHFTHASHSNTGLVAQEIASISISTSVIGIHRA